jgi:hypothetical protein
MFNPEEGGKTFARVVRMLFDDITLISAVNDGASKPKQVRTIEFNRLSGDSFENLEYRWKEL